MAEGNYKRKKVKKKTRRKRKWVQKFVLISILVIAGYFAVRYIPQMYFGEVDIVLDAGHGGNDPGAVSGDVVEKEITLELAARTQELLEKSGYKVGMTRKGDSYMELSERAAYANRRNAKVFVSIHCNASENPDGNGIETFFTASKGLKDETLAKMVHTTVIELTAANDRGTKSADFTVIARSDMPAVLIEVGFLTNEEEKKMLQDKSYQENLAKGIVEGIKRYLQSTDCNAKSVDVGNLYL